MAWNCLGRPRPSLVGAGGLFFFFFFFFFFFCFLGLFALLWVLFETGCRRCCCLRPFFRCVCFCGYEPHSNPPPPLFSFSVHRSFGRVRQARVRHFPDRRVLRAGRVWHGRHLYRQRMGRRRRARYAHHPAPFPLRLGVLIGFLFSSHVG